MSSKTKLKHAKRLIANHDVEGARQILLTMEDQEAKLLLSQLENPHQMPARPLGPPPPFPIGQSPLEQDKQRQAAQDVIFGNLAEFGFLLFIMVVMGGCGFLSVVWTGRIMVELLCAGVGVLVGSYAVINLMAIGRKA